MAIIDRTRRVDVKALMFANLTSFTAIPLPFAPANNYEFQEGDRLFYDGETPDGMGGNIALDYTASGVYVFHDNGDSTGELTRAPDWSEGTIAEKGQLVHVGTAGCDATNVPINTYFILTQDVVIGSGDIIPDGPGSWASVPHKQSKTLTGTDITNQYVNLAYLAMEFSIDLVFNHQLLYENIDYTLSVAPNGHTRVTFAGDYATGGSTPFVASDVLKFKYMRQNGA